MMSTVDSNILATDAQRAVNLVNTLTNSNTLKKIGEEDGDVTFDGNKIIRDFVENPIDLNTEASGTLKIGTF